MAEMGVYEAMRTLKAVRRLKPDPIPDDVLHRVLEAATWAPTGGNRQPWRIIAVNPLVHFSDLLDELFGHGLTPDQGNVEFVGECSQQRLDGGEVVDLGSGCCHVFMSVDAKES